MSNHKFNTEEVLLSECINSLHLMLQTIINYRYEEPKHGELRNIRSKLRDIKRKVVNCQKSCLEKDDEYMKLKPKLKEKYIIKTTEELKADTDT